MLNELAQLQDMLFRPLAFVRAYDPAFLPLVGLFLLLVALAATFPLVVLRGWFRLITATVTLSSGLLVAGVTGAWAYAIIQGPEASPRTCPQVAKVASQKQNKPVHVPKAATSVSRDHRRDGATNQREDGAITPSCLANSQPIKTRTTHE